MAWVEARVRGGRKRYTGVYRDAAGRKRSAGTFDSSKDAKKAAQKAEGRIETGEWINPTDSRITFREYVETLWWPNLMLEVSTMAAYRSYLDCHFLPAFGDMPMGRIVPTTVQAWIKQASESGLSARSVVKYHAMLSSLFKHAVANKVIANNPCAVTRLPKVPKWRIVARRRRVVTPEDFDRLLAEVPARHRPLVLTDIETGLRWGELIALRPRHIDFAGRVVHVEQVIVEVSKKNSPTGERYIVKDLPKDDEPRSLRVSQQLIDILTMHIAWLGLGDDDLLFTFERRHGLPMSRTTFRTRHWLPALEHAELGYQPTVRDLRHAHASWLLAGGADLQTVKERMGHAKITTTELYLHTLPDAEDKAMTAFATIRHRSP